MKLGKVPGYDGIYPEMLKYMGEKGKEVLLDITRMAWRNKSIPKD